MKKNLFKSLFIIASLFSLAACGGGQKDPDPKPDPTPVVTKELIIEQNDVMLEKYEGVQLTYVAKNIDEVLVWSSSQEEVATIDQKGYVNALAIGETTITLKGTDISATCKITVIQPTEAAVLHIESTKMNIIKNSTVTIDLYATYKGEKVDGEYTFVPDEGESENTISVSYENFRLSIKGLKVGSTKYLLSATIRDTLLVGSFSVTVANI